MYTYIHLYVYTYTHIYIYTYIHIYIRITFVSKMFPLWVHGAPPARTPLLHLRRVKHPSMSEVQWEPWPTWEEISSCINPADPELLPTMHQRSTPMLRHIAVQIGAATYYYSKRGKYVYLSREELKEQIRITHRWLAMSLDELQQEVVSWGGTPSKIRSENLTLLRDLVFPCIQVECRERAAITTDSVVEEASR